MCENISSRKDILGCIAWKASKLFVLWGYLLIVGAKREGLSPWPSGRAFCTAEQMPKGGVAKALLTVRNTVVNPIAEGDAFFPG